LFVGIQVIDEILERLANGLREGAVEVGPGTSARSIHVDEVFERGADAAVDAIALGHVDYFGIDDTEHFVEELAGLAFAEGGGWRAAAEAFGKQSFEKSGGGPPVFVEAHCKATSGFCSAKISNRRTSLANSGSRFISRRIVRTEQRTSFAAFTRSKPPDISSMISLRLAMSRVRGRPGGAFAFGMPSVGAAVVCRCVEMGFKSSDETAFMGWLARSVVAR